MTMIRGGADEPITTLCGFIGFAQFPYHRIFGLGGERRESQLAQPVQALNSAVVAVAAGPPGAGSARVAAWRQASR